MAKDSLKQVGLTVSDVKRVRLASDTDVALTELEDDDEVSGSEIIRDRHFRVAGLTTLNLPAGLRRSGRQPSLEAPAPGDAALETKVGSGPGWLPHSLEVGIRSPGRIGRSGPRTYERRGRNGLGRGCPDGRGFGCRV